ncbi:hypothetical protein AB1Y20_014355 [Prymnesium parvum]|uniref:Disintegrin domain-containing protein n=1 Tax=Prymnesium parvum TaxID=97485 RepID=A0AB34IDS0_PRYPA
MRASLKLLLLIAPLASPRPAAPPRGTQPAYDVRVSSGRRQLRLGASLHHEETLHVSFRTAAAFFAADLRRVELWAAGAKLLVNERGVTTDTPLPRLPAFRGHLANVSGSGGVSAALLADGTLRLHVFEAGHDLLLEAAAGGGGEGVVYDGLAAEAARGTDEVLHHSATPLQGAHAPTGRRALSTLNTLPSGPPYGRLSSCLAQPALSTTNIGIVVDWGFSAAVGGSLAAVSAEVASLLTQTNVIFNDQVGVDLALGTLLVNLDDSATLAAGGPNYKPSTSGTRDTCGAALLDAYTTESMAASSGGTVSVEVAGGPFKLLGRFSNWVGASAPACTRCSHWHLLTDCFPAPGTVGIAFTSASCERLVSSRGKAADAAAACAACDVRLPNGNAASLSYTSGEACPAGEYVCFAPTALTSYGGASTWRTFAHEVGHTFGAEHTFGLGGLMDYTSDEQFYDNGQVCAFVNGVLGTSGQTCLADANAVCGDGAVAYGGAEACDDGNTQPSDGCAAACTVECGYSCAHSGGASTCTAYCGNGAVDAVAYEECDDSSACCAACRLADGAACSTGECCAGCALATSTTSCGTSGGFCGAGGACVASKCYNYAGLSSCAKAAAATCHEHCVISGACRDLTAFVSPASSGYLASGTPCTTAAGAAGECSAAGECVASTCGDGVVQGVEECDDATQCCDQTNCRLVQGAVCSSGECCNADCSFKTAATSCGGGTGYCRRGACETEQTLCSFTLDGASAAVDTAMTHTVRQHLLSSPRRAS